MFIIMLGGPGSGKGSVGGILANYYKIPHISTGDIFRNEIKKETELGLTIKELIANGQLVSDDLTIKIVENRLLQSDCENGVVLDGFPRTQAQAIALENFMKENNRKIDAAVELDVSDEDLTKRIVNRVVCSNKECGESYNTVFMPPKVEGKCDKCGSDLYRRADDNEESVKNRLEVYHKQSDDILKFYRNNGLLFTVKPDIYSPTVLQDSVKTIEEFLNQ